MALLCKSSAQQRQLLMSLQPPEALGCFLHRRSGPAQCHRGHRASISRCGRPAGCVPMHVLDDVGAGERAAKLQRKLETNHGQHLVHALPGSSPRRRAPSAPAGAPDYGSGCSAFAASSSSQAWRSVRRTEACRCLGSRSRMLRPLCTWQRWMGVCLPKVRRIAFRSAFDPSMMNSAADLRVQTPLNASCPAAPAPPRRSRSRLPAHRAGASRLPRQCRPLRSSTRSFSM